MTEEQREGRWKDVVSSNRDDMTACTQTLAKRYLADFPDSSSSAWVLFAESLYSVARYTEALAALRTAIRRCPAKHLHLVQSHFGHLYKQQGRFRRAEGWFRRAINSCPRHASAYIYLGALLASEGRLLEAEAVHREGTQCKEGSIDEAFLNLGLVLRAQGRYPEARDCFRRALKIDPKYKAAQKKLSDVERALKLEREG